MIPHVDRWGLDWRRTMLPPHDDPEPGITFVLRVLAAGYVLIGLGLLASGIAIGMYFF